jgi:hypothetical protein
VSGHDKVKIDTNGKLTNQGNSAKGSIVTVTVTVTLNDGRNITIARDITVQ